MPSRTSLASLCLAAALSLPALAAAQAPPARVLISAAWLSSSLAAQGLAVTTPEAVHLAAPVTALTSTPPLEIRAAELRPDGSLLVNLACRNKGDCLPFFAGVALPSHTATIAALANLHPSLASTSSTLPGVSAGAHITLQLTGPHTEIQLPAIAIDTGSPGTEVRVASLDRKHTWRGVVVDRITVRGDVE